MTKGRRVKLKEGVDADSTGRGNRRGGARTEAREPDKCESEGARLEAHIYNRHQHICPTIQGWDLRVGTQA